MNSFTIILKMLKQSRKSLHHLDVMIRKSMRFQSAQPNEGNESIQKYDRTS